MTPYRSPLSVLAAPVRALFVKDSAAGLLLIAVAVIAMAAANSPFARLYHDFFHDPLWWSPVAKLGNLHLWINDGLMAVFFLLVALEIKRETLSGQLAGREQLLLPMVCASAGVAMPALLFTAFYHAEDAAMRGGAVPTATDIAFALVLYPMLRGDLRISRGEGAILVVAFAAWLGFECWMLR